MQNKDVFSVTVVLLQPQMPAQFLMTYIFFTKPSKHKSNQYRTKMPFRRKL